MQVTKAYDAVKEVNYLDLSQAGQQAWESSMQYYKDHISRIETQVTLITVKLINSFSPQTCFL
jgi:hypothetical protein